MLNIIEKLKYNDHDVAYPNKFPQFSQDKYMTIIVKPRVQQFCEPQQWARGPDKSGILNLLDIPHFGLSIEVNICAIK